MQCKFPIDDVQPITECQKAFQAKFPWILCFFLPIFSQEFLVTVYFSVSLQKEVSNLGKYKNTGHQKGEGNTHAKFVGKITILKWKPCFLISLDLR